ncbi:MAG TPA: hypothetical protein VGS80_25235 [Ktedonobacterales bacterium]|nr:hypothetical protein [Ktedonobacterales bacterium]
MDVTRGMTMKSSRYRAPRPPDVVHLPLVNASAQVAHWLEHYWHKLRVPATEARRLAVTDDRHEFHYWTGKRLNPLALGCYCYLPTGSPNDMVLASDASATTATLTAPASAPSRIQLALPGFGDATAEQPLPVPASVAVDYRHLVFVEPTLVPLGIEVTVAHELIHLSDRVQGTPRKHRCHGYDSISVDEAAITGREPELLRALLREETERREQALRQVRPNRYLYVCPQCGKEYARVRRYTRPVSCGRCDRQFNAAFVLELRATFGRNGQIVPIMPAEASPKVDLH